jgi:hypothetical protein
MNSPIFKSVANKLSHTLCAGIALTALSMPALLRADTIDRSAGFPNANGLTINQQAGVPNITWNAINNNELVLITSQKDANGQGAFESESVFYSTPVTISTFKTSFDFLITGNQGWMADGITFCIQNQGPNALGGNGGGIGYGADPNNSSQPSIGKSVAVKFDVFQNWPDPSDSCTGLFTNGATPVGGIDLLPSNVNLQSGDPMRATLSYDGKILTVTITDTLTQASATQTYPIDIPGTVGGQTAYVGFTGADGAAVSDASVLTWFYTSPATAAVVNSISVSPSSLCGGLSAQGTVTLQQSVPTDTLIALASTNPAASVPSTVTVPAGQTSVSFPVVTQITAKVVSASLSASLHSTTVKTTLSVCPIGVGTVTVSVNYVAAGQPSVGTVTLQVPAAPGDQTVTLSSANPAVATIPSGVVVPAGATSVNFPIHTGAVRGNTPVLITAGLNGTARTTTLTVRPLRVSSVLTSGGIVAGGKSLTATVTLEAVATAGGVVVTLSSNAGSLQVPSSVVVPAGATSVSFPVSSTTVKVSTNATITASSPMNNVYTTVVVSP